MTQNRLPARRLPILEPELSIVSEARQDFKEPARQRHGIHAALLKLRRRRRLMIQGVHVR